MFDVEYLKSLEGKRPIIDRLMSKVEKNNSSGCWIFKGGIDRSGYGRIKIGKHNLGAHKVAYLIMVGDYDQSSFELMHKCDNPACVNPSHLKPGTHKENIDDCISKGRHLSQRFINRSAHHQWHPIAIFSTRKLAAALGEKTYLGSACGRHLMATRKTNNGACIYCADEYRSNKTASRRLDRTS